MLFQNITIVNDSFTIEENKYVGVEGAKITYIGAEMPADPKRFGEVYDGRGKVLMPGFYNAHGHSPMSLMRGYGENLPLDRWLNERIFPFEAKMYGEAAYWATLLTMAESARFGVVSTSDMYFFIDDMVRAISTAGAKTNICRSVTNIPQVAPQDNPLLKDMRESILMYDGFQDGRVKVDACLHAEYTNDDATVDAVAEIAHDLDVMVHVHVAETEAETKGCMERHDGLTPVQYLSKHGLFDQGGIAAHCVWLNEQDRLILKEKKMTVASNPLSNLKLTSGICDVPALYEAGVNVAIGTDSVSSNNSLNFFEEMKMFALLGKMKSGDPSKMTPEEVLYSATRAGALAQGREDCGLIREGYHADLIVIDTEVPNMQPVHNVLNNLVYSAAGTEVCLTMVDGQILYRDGNYPTIDVEKAAAETTAAKDKILRS